MCAKNIEICTYIQKKKNGMNKAKWPNIANLINQN